MDISGEGKRVAVVERKYIGGSCPNIACLPSKNIIHSFESLIQNEGKTVNMFLNDELDVFDPQSLANVHNEIHRDIARSEMGLRRSSSDKLGRNRILCVDDEMMATATRVEVLREHGYAVDVYHSPLAVLHCDLSMFDLAILDFFMPGLNGRELFLRMRALGAGFPIVLLTGCLETLSHEECVLFARCIDKGMPIRHLLDTIAEFLDPNLIPDYGS